WLEWYDEDVDIAKVWVKVTDDLSGNQSIRIYYGYTGDYAAFRVASPTKYGSNPVMPGGIGTYDYHIQHPSVITHSDWGDEIKMWYAGGENGWTDYFICYANSTTTRIAADPTDWDKPNLGLVAHDGDGGANNIQVETQVGGGVIYDNTFDWGTSNEDYIQLINTDIWHSSDGGVADPWAQEAIASLAKNTGFIAQLPDDTWLVPYQGIHRVDAIAELKRYYGSYISDSTDPYDTYTDYYETHYLESLDEQIYNAGASRHGELTLIFEGS
ncbi:unnamed protein product, partial [marine sediment metagenome]